MAAGRLQTRAAGKLTKLTNMKNELYDQIMDEIHFLPNNATDVVDVLSKSFPAVEPRTLGSIYAQEYQRKTKRQHHKHYTNEASRTYYNKYLTAVNSNESPGIIQRIAEEIADISPCLMSRIILEQSISKQGILSDSLKQQVSKLMKDTTLIEDKDLAFEVYLCVLQDDNYGPIADSIKHSMGYEYECRLRMLLEEQGLSFIEEDHMRAKGYDKTPDFKMEIPFAVNGFVVNWVESKASFGDSESHQNYLKDQFWSYWNRFGSGMVIYWFGYIEELDIHRNKGIMLQTDLPVGNIVKMDPTSI